MNPKEYRYTSEHEWIRLESPDQVKAGLTNYAQDQLGDIVFLDLPVAGTQVVQSEKMGEIESVKAVVDFFSPASGKVLEVNQTVIDAPQLVNQDPYGAGWLVELELSNHSELATLMNGDEYDKFIAELEEEGTE